MLILLHFFLLNLNDILKIKYTDIQYTEIYKNCKYNLLKLLCFYKYKLSYNSVKYIGTCFD